MAAIRMMGLCSLMRSGETTRAGRSPACSEPTTGSSRTRTTSPRFGLAVDGTVDLLFKRVVLALDFEVNLGHVAATLDDLLAQLLAAVAVEPALHQGRYDRDSFG